MPFKILVISYNMELYRELQKRMEPQSEVMYQRFSQSSYVKIEPEKNIDLCVIEVFHLTSESADVICRIRGMDVPILLLSTSKTEEKAEEKVKAIELGVDEYLSGNQTFDEITASCRALMRWKDRFNREPEVLNIDGLQIFPESRQAYLNKKEILFTKLEFDIVLYLALHCTRAVTYQELYEAVWKREYLLDDFNIMSHIHRIRKKLGETPYGTDYIQNIYGVGYRFCSIQPFEFENDGLENTKCSKS